MNAGKKEGQDKKKKKIFEGRLWKEEKKGKEKSRRGNLCNRFASGEGRRENGGKSGTALEKTELP